MKMTKTESIGEIKVGSYIPTSFLDWDGNVSAVIFLMGCNFRCPWCHNGQLATMALKSLKIENIIADIERRTEFLDGVVITGGEPLLQKNVIPLLEKFAEMKIRVKLDTNGSNPDILEEILKKNLADFIAMDIKAPLDSTSYERMTGAEIDIEKIKKSISLIKNSAKDYEFRTTYVPALMDTKNLTEIKQQIADTAHWVLQLFRPNNCLSENFREMPAAQAEQLKDFAAEIKIRG